MKLKIIMGLKKIKSQIIKENQKFSITALKRDKPIKELLEFGIINVDKPSGPTSFNISDFVRKNLRLRKTSHFGTLDPKVTGVLPIALNRACKLTGFFLREDKEYVGVMRIHKDIKMQEIQKTINKNFVGKIKQTPPVKSRVKRQEREREIKKFKLLEQEGRNILFYVECECGTYIRKLISDLGEKLGIGAHMLELRRTRAGIFREKDKEFINLYDFEKAISEYKGGNDRLLREIIIPGEIISKIYPVVKIKKDFLDKTLHGCPIYHKFLIKKKEIETGKTICVFCEKKFVGMYKIINNKNIFAIGEFVLQPLKDKI